MNNIVIVIINNIKVNSAKYLKKAFYIFSKTTIKIQISDCEMINNYKIN